MQWYNNKYILNNKFSFRLLAICSKLRTRLSLHLDCVVLENENLSFFFPSKTFFLLGKIYHLLYYFRLSDAFFNLIIKDLESLPFQH